MSMGRLRNTWSDRIIFFCREGQSVDDMPKQNRSGLIRVEDEKEETEEVGNGGFG